LAIGIINIIDILVEIFIDSHVIRQKSNSVAGNILCKYKSQVKEIVLAVIIGCALTVGITFAMVHGFGLRKCHQG
jgi:hypothetical protein